MPCWFEVIHPSFPLTFASWRIPYMWSKLTSGPSLSSTMYAWLGQDIWKICNVSYNFWMNLRNLIKWAISCIFLVFSFTLRFCLDLQSLCEAFLQSHRIMVTALLRVQRNPLNFKKCTYIPFYLRVLGYYGEFYY